MKLFSPFGVLNEVEFVIELTIINYN